MKYIYDIYMLYIYAIYIYYMFYNIFKKAQQVNWLFLYTKLFTNYYKPE